MTKIINDKGNILRHKKREIIYGDDIGGLG